MNVEHGRYETPSAEIVLIRGMENVCDNASAPKFTVDSYTPDWEDEE